MKPLRPLVFCLIFLIITKPIFAQVNLDVGLIGHWPLDGDATDISGNNRTGQVFGTLIPAPDRFGGAGRALSFNGAGSFIRVIDNGDLNTDKFSVSVWFQTSSDNIQTIIGKIKYDQNPQNEQLQLGINWPLTNGVGSVLVPQGAPCNLGHLFAESKLATGTSLCKLRWYHLIVSFDGVDHKLFLDGKLKASRKTAFTKITSCLGDYQFGSWRNGDFQYFEGLMDDIRIYDRALNDEEVAVLGEQQTGIEKYDFSYLQNICNPLEVSFFYNGPGSRIRWNFENNEKGEGKRPVHLFSKNDQFPVSMIVEYSNCLTNDTLIKNVNLNTNLANLINSNDTVICKGASFQIKTTIPNEFCWSENEFLSNTTIAEPVAQPERDTVFYLNHKREGVNLVLNGDFTAGNTGFTSTYNYQSNNTTEGEYFVSPFPRNWNGALSTCVQPDGTTGNMMLVNGVPEPNKVVWQQEITVVANKTYDFSLNITALYPPNPALLQFAINGIIVGDSIEANSVPCTWRKFNVTWNSASSTKAIISIVNRNTEVQGNDFAMDNIAFREIIYESDSIRVKVETGELEVTKDTSICKNGMVPLVAKGANTYSWAPANGLSNPNISNPTATINGNITYLVTGQTAAGCLLQGQVQINALDLPVSKLTPANISICGKDTVQLLAEGGTQYLWSPGAYFNNTTIANPTVILDTNLTLRVRITDANGCSVMDSILVDSKSNSTFDINPKTATVCAGDSVRFVATGGDSYLWNAAPGLSNLSQPSILARPSADITYQVRIINSACNDTAFLSSNIQISNPPTVGISKTGDLTCDVATVQLRATGGVSYIWEPSTGLSNPNIANPTVSIQTSTLFKVTVRDSIGCTASDTISVHYINSGNFTLYQLPTAFTPNGDGLNDCFGINKWGAGIQLDQFQIFNRWGQLVFTGNASNPCWDGRFKGQMQPTGNFIYYLNARTNCGNIKRKGDFMLIK